MRFDVFLQGAIDSTADGIDSLANAIANRFGISAASIKNNLAAGQVRIKANVGRSVADSFAKDLVSLGGLAIVVAANGGAGSDGSHAGTARGNAASSPVSGLSAAARWNGDNQGDFAALGSLRLNDSAALSTLDGSVSAPTHSKPPAFAPPGSSEVDEDAAGSAVGHRGSAADHGARAPDKKAKPDAPTLDLFAPPDELAESAPTLMEEASPRAARAVAYAEQQASAVLASAIAAPAALAAKPPLLAPLADVRRRIAAGAIVAVLLGGIPAVLVASARERAEFKLIDARVALIQNESDTMEAWDNLDVMRRNQMDRKRAVQRSAATVALATWIVVGGALAYGWFRLPWQRLTSP